MRKIAAQRANLDAIRGLFMGLERWAPVNL
jgi:hypothetical protein